MKLVDMQLKEFVNVLGSDAPAPGGGSASALAAAQGIALTKMVAELTIGKKKYADFETEMKNLQQKAADLQAELLVSIDEDTAAFNQVSAVFEMPKSSEEEKKSAAEHSKKLCKEPQLHRLI